MLYVLRLLRHIHYYGEIGLLLVEADAFAFTSISGGAINGIFGFVDFATHGSVSQFWH